MDKLYLEHFQKSVTICLVGKRLDIISFSKDRYRDTGVMKDKKAYFVIDAPHREKHGLYIPKLFLGFGTQNKESYKVTVTEFRCYIGILCTWHLLKNAQSIAAYVGEYDSDGYMEKNLELIKNQIVKRVVLIPEKLNLFIELNNNMWLGVFPDFVGYSFSVDSGEGRAWSSDGYTIFNNDIHPFNRMS